MTNVTHGHSVRSLYDAQHAVIDSTPCTASRASHGTQRSSLAGPHRLTNDRVYPGSLVRRRITSPRPGHGRGGPRTMQPRNRLTMTERLRTAWIRRVPCRRTLSVRETQKRCRLSQAKVDLTKQDRGFQTECIPPTMQSTSDYVSSFVQPLRD